jgi:hypothetical protein
MKDTDCYSSHHEYRHCKTNCSFTSDVPLLVFKLSEFSAMCILLLLHSFCIYSCTFMGPIKAHTKPRDNCEVSAVPTHVCTAVCDLLSCRPTHSAMEPNSTDCHAVVFNISALYSEGPGSNLGLDTG